MAQSAFISANARSANGKADMVIRFTKRGSRNLLHCARADGTTASADIGPSVPHHDLAHFVVERSFGLTEGFFGNVARGYTPEQLSDKHVIKRLGIEPYRAEILARALGSLDTGACAPEQFEELVNSELSALGLSRMRIGAEVRDALLAEFKAHLATYGSLRQGESMTLQFVTCGSGAPNYTQPTKPVVESCRTEG